MENEPQLLNLLESTDRSLQPSAQKGRHFLDTDNNLHPPELFLGPCNWAHEAWRTTMLSEIDTQLQSWLSQGKAMCVQSQGGKKPCSQKGQGCPTIKRLLSRQPCQVAGRYLTHAVPGPWHTTLSLKIYTPSLLTQNSEICF